MLDCCRAGMGVKVELSLRPAVTVDISLVPSPTSSCGGSDCSDKIPVLRLPAEDGGSPDKLLSCPLSSAPSAPVTGLCSGSCTLSKASVAAVRQAAAAAQLPGKARRRIVWDSQLRLRAFWLTVFFCVLAFFWAWRFQQYSRGPRRALFGPSLPFAKACGNAMKIAIWPVLILPLSYVFTTPLRLTWLDRFVPFDMAVPFHMLVAGIGGLLAVVHGICHIIDYAHAAHQSAELWDAAFPGMPQQLSFWRLLNQESTYTGLAMLTVLLVMFAFALPYPRKSAWLRNTAVGRVLNDYDWFWTSHKFGAGIFFVLLILHPLPGALRRVENPFAWNATPSEWGFSDAWVWVSIPILIRLADRGIRWYRRNRRPARILGAEFMADGIVALRISRPKGFHFRPGMYVYLCIPAVAKLQWHPLSLAGSPSADSLAVLVSNSGDWASALHERLRRQIAAPPRTNMEVPGSPEPLLRTPGPLRAQYQLHQDSMAQAMQAQSLSELELLLDGPFGAPSVAYTRFPVVLLVGAGIGVTPFLSILADAVEQQARRAAAAAAQPPCSDGVQSECCRPNAEAPVQKVHFHWLVREPAIPWWLRQTLQTAAKADASQLLDINVHLTKALSRPQSYLSLSKALGKASMASDMDAAERGEAASGDGLPTGSAVKAWHGRPDFEATLHDLEQQYPGGHVGVFYCGGAALRHTLAALCLRRSAAGKTFFHFRAERF